MVKYKKPNTYFIQEYVPWENELSCVMFQVQMLS